MLAVRLTSRCLLACVLLCGVAAYAGTDDAVTDVPVRRVVLYSSGVGYFEHAGKVNGNARAELRFKSDQINDLLKSLVLEDLGGGRVGTVVYPSQDPLSKTLKSFQVDISGNPSLGDLLNQLRGAKVTVVMPAERYNGVILGLEQQQRPVDEGKPVSVWVMNLLDGGTVRAIELSKAQQITLDDEQLQGELNRALTALTQARDQDKKPVLINFNGQGDRPVRLGYVVETPIWKTTYRLLMPEDADSDTGKLQGWAIVENQTESDWDDVTLSLVSGRPISFIQDLYQPLYIPRPVVQPELYASLMPQSYAEGIESATDEEVSRFANAPASRFGRSAGRGVAKALAAPRAEMAEAESTRGLYFDGGFGGGGIAGAVGGINAAASVASLASAADVGELFQYTVPDVSLPRQRSAMIPIVTDDIHVERLSIYNQQVMAKHPLNGARIKNTTGKHLLQGPVTVIDDRAYAGDARIDDVPEDQTRLLSYAVDLDVRVDATAAADNTWIQTANLVRGVLYVKRKQVHRQEYLVDNKGDRERTMLIEHPLRRGWNLVDTPEPVEKTESLYRFEDKVAAGEKSKLAVTEERIYSESVAVLPSDVGTLLAYSRSGEIPQNVRDALAEIVRRKQALADTERQIAERESQVRDITTEQNRIRENMKTVDNSSKYYARLLSKLDEQETDIERLQSEITNLRKTADQQRADLEDHIAKLNVG